MAMQVLNESVIVVYVLSVSWWLFYSDHLGKEIVSRFTTDINNNGTWYTDSNGREMQKRM